jgi:hypothetical protein
MKGLGSLLWPIACGFVFAASTAPFALAADPTLSTWLPDLNSGFDAWSKGQATRVAQYDYFVCGSSMTPTVPKQNLGYAGSACPLLTNGTLFVNVSAGPTKGHVVYDSAHGIVLYEKGCCAERGVALTTEIAKPPKPVSNANLTGVHTMRGVTLGMTAVQVEKIYGTTRPHTVKVQPGLVTLSYTTMKGTPTKSAGDTCGQFQSFTFRQNRLVTIELLAGC